MLLMPAANSLRNHHIFYDRKYDKSKRLCPVCHRTGNMTRLNRYIECGVPFYNVYVVYVAYKIHLMSFWEWSEVWCSFFFFFFFCFLVFVFCKLIVYTGVYIGGRNVFSNYNWSFPMPIWLQSDLITYWLAIDACMNHVISKSLALDIRLSLACFLLLREPENIKADLNSK